MPLFFSPLSFYFHIQVLIQAIQFNSIQFDSKNMCIVILVSICCVISNINIYIYIYISLFINFYSNIHKGRRKYGSLSPITNSISIRLFIALLNDETFDLFISIR